MRKLMLLAAMLAMVLVAAAPAFAQEVTVAEVKAENSDVAFCQNVAVQVIENQPRVTQTINANAEAAAAAAGFVVATDEGDVDIDDIDVDDVVAVADADTAVDSMINAGVTAEIAQECVATIAGAEVVTPAADGDGAAPAKDGEAKKGEAKAAELPKTGGGASLFALGAGALLVAGGLVARRMIR